MAKHTPLSPPAPAFGKQRPPCRIGIAVTPPLKTKAQSGCTIGLGMLLFVESWLGSKLYPQHLSAAPAHAAPARREMAHRCQ